MALIKVKARQTTGIERVSEGQDVYLKAFRDGTLTVADLIAAWSFEGKVFCANAGTITTPITFGAGSIDSGEYDLHVSVPSDKVIFPLSLRIKMEAYGTTAIFETMACYGTGSTCGAGTTITPVNVNTGSSNASSCTITAAATTTSGVAFTGKYVEFFRDGLQKVATTATGDDDSARSGETFPWYAKNEGIMRQVGPSAQLAVFAAAQAGTGFIIFEYAELLSATVL